MRFFTLTALLCLSFAAIAQPIPFSGTITGNVTLNVPSDFSSVSAALIYLENKKIDHAYTVTIQIDNGTYTSQNTLNLSHPNGDRIQIVGNAASPSSVRLEFASGQAGVSMTGNNSLGLLTGVTLVGQQESGVHGVNLSNNASIKAEDVVIDGFNHGVYAHSNASLTGDSITSQNNSASGLYAFNGATIAITAAVSTGNTHHGACSYNNGMIQIQNSQMTNNGVNGLTADRFARIDARGAVVTGNALHGIYCADSSAVSIKTGTVSGNLVNFSPAADVIGNGNSLINTTY